MITFRFERPYGTIDDTIVGSVKGAKLQHLTLILDQELDAFDGSSSCLGDDSRSARESKALGETEILTLALALAHGCGCVGANTVKVKLLAPSKPHSNNLSLLQTY